jgi:drug/metabolite transporter (DMT)-like permease
MSARNFTLLLVSAVIGIALGHVFYYMSIARLGVAVTTGVLQVHPFTVAVASYFVFGEVLSAPQWVSGSIAVVGALMMLGVQRRLTRRLVPAPVPPVPPVPAGAAATRRR